jgi:hypothetical protein
MPEASPENANWLKELVTRSALLPDPRLRAHWQRIVPWLPTAARYELAATLLDAERWLAEPDHRP